MTVLPLPAFGEILQHLDQPIRGGDHGSHFVMETFQSLLVGLGDAHEVFGPLIVSGGNGPELLNGA
jgi:hypothetical protein